MGGITIYRTFALYEEKKEFNVLRGRVPDFSNNYDVSILAITVDGEKTNTIPEPNNYVVNVDCQNGSGYWDYSNWNAVITEINSQTKCNLHFETSSETNEWRTWIQKGRVTKYYTTLHNFLSDSEAVTQVFNNKEASNYLIENKAIINAIKEDSLYYVSSLPSGGVGSDYRSNLVKIILESTALTNRQKYDNGLPCHIYKNGDALVSFKNSYGQSYGTDARFNANLTSSIYLYMKATQSNCANNTYTSNGNIDCTNYKMYSLRYSASRGIAGFNYSISLGSTNFSNSFGSGYYSMNISSLTANNSIKLQLSACDSNATYYETILNVYEWYMY